MDFARHATTSWDTYSKVVIVREEPWRAVPLNGGHDDPSQAVPSNPVAVPPRGVIITKPASIAYEDLGWRTIENVSAHGARRTVVYPAGSFGSDRPVTTTEEVWYAPDPGVQVRWILTNETGATTTRALTDIHAGDPDPALFEIPKSGQAPE
ncbi:MAG: hypothetical protein ACLGSD_10925 [Acidobacteriota bacterium]